MFSICQLWVRKEIQLKLGLVLIVTGFILEYFQNFIDNRTFEFSDISAQILGVVLGYLIYRDSKRIRINEPSSIKEIQIKHPEIKNFIG